jgi:hypothetical protein
MTPYLHNQEWSDRRPAGWPSEQPVWAITALVLAAAMIPALLFYQYRQEWTALQRYYLGAFVRSQAYASGLFSSPLLAWRWGFRESHHNA